MTDPLSAGSILVESLTGDQVVTVPLDTTLIAVATLMRERDVSVVAVGDPTAPAAILSERDLAHAVADGVDPTTSFAATAAQAELVWAPGDASVAEVAQEMMRRWVRHVLVGRPGHLLGIVSARDLLGVYASEDGEEPA